MIQSFLPKNNNFYKDYYTKFLILLMALIVLLTLILFIVLLQIYYRPLPEFEAVQPDGKSMFLTPFDRPNQLPDTIIRWASKAVTTAYTFDFVNYKAQLEVARPFFTSAGWIDYYNSVKSRLLSDIEAKQLKVNGIVSGRPIISNEGDIPEKGYSWRIQIPFLVTYQSSNQTVKRQFNVAVTIIQIPTTVNPQGIGIDQFVMRPGRA